MKILFVEDNARFVRLASAQFFANQEVIDVASVGDAVRMLSAQSFDAVLLDYDLPDGKGDAVAHVATLLSPRPFLVAISSHPTGNARLMEAGADVICSKMTFASIISVLERLDVPDKS